MNKKKGFTIVELIAVIGILALIAGIFAVNMVRTLNKNRDTEESNVITRIKSAADSYVSMNPEKLEDLHIGFNFVDIPIEVLRNAGLLSEDLKDPKTGEIIPDDDIVRVELNKDKEDSIKITYPVDKDAEENIESWILIAKNITIKSEANSNWCAENQYKDLELKNNKGDTYTESFTDKPELKAVCNVDPSKAGEYTITYTFKDMATGRIKTVERKVTVLSSTRDVVSFDVVIIGNIKNGTEILQNSDLNEVTFQITEKYRDGAPNTFERTISNASEYGYSITGVTNDTPGTRSATVTRIVSNSDGSIPTSRNPKYTVRKNTYTLTLNPTGGSVSTKKVTVTVNKTYGEAFTNNSIPNASRTNYLFNGWYTEKSGGTKIYASTVFTSFEDQTIYAHWTYNPPPIDPPPIDPPSTETCKDYVIVYYSCRDSTCSNGYCDLTDRPADCEYKKYTCWCCPSGYYMSDEFMKCCKG